LIGGYIGAALSPLLSLKRGGACSAPFYFTKGMIFLKKRLSVFFSVFCVIALIAITMIPAFADVPANPEDNTLYPYRVELTGYITTNDGVRHVLRSLVVSSSKFGMGLRQSSYTSGQWCQTYDYDLTDGQTVYFLNYRDGVLHDDHTYTMVIFSLNQIMSIINKGPISLGASAAAWNKRAGKGNDE